MYLLHFAVVVDHLLNKLQIESEQKVIYIYFFFDFLQKHVCTGA